MNKGYQCSIGIFIIGVLLTLIQMWFEPFSAEHFSKLFLSLGIALVAMVGVTIAVVEYGKEKKMKDDGFLD